MHGVGMKAAYLDRESVPQEAVARERDVLTAQVRCGVVDLLGLGNAATVACCCVEASRSWHCISITKAALPTALMVLPLPGIAQCSLVFDFEIAGRQQRPA